MLLDKPFPPDTRVENEIESLMNNGHMVFLMCYDTGGDCKHTEPYDVKIPQWFHDKFSAVCLTVPFFFWAWKYWVRRMAKRFSIDAIHVHDLRLGKIGAWAKKKYGWRYTLDLHENYPAALEQYAFANTWLGKRLISIPKWRRYEVEQIKAADRIIVVIEEMAKRIYELGGENIYVVPNYVNVEKIHEFSLRDKTKLLYFGGMDRHRGLETLIDAAPDWQR
jgi:glycosyltransferase involved in cell wall biosynthesis